MEGWFRHKANKDSKGRTTRKNRVRGDSSRRKLELLMEGIERRDLE